MEEPAFPMRASPIFRDYKPCANGMMAVQDAVSVRFNIYSLTNVGSNLLQTRVRGDSYRFQYLVGKKLTSRIAGPTRVPGSNVRMVGD
jgi:hypothetical protein